MSRGIVDRLKRWEVGGANGAVLAIEREPGRPWVRLVIEDGGKRSVVCFDLEHEDDPGALAQLGALLQAFGAGVTE